MAGKTKHTEVPIKKLRWRCDPKIFPFRSTAKAKSLDGILGQARALDAIMLGLKMRSPGYNIYIAGLSGTGKTTTVRTLLSDFLKGDRQQPGDICYVHNFRDENMPKALCLEAGCGKKLAKEMDELVDMLGKFIPALFESKDFKKQRNQIVERYESQQRETFFELEKNLRQENFALVQIQMGNLTRPAIMPVIDEQPVPMEQLEAQVATGEFPPAKFKKMKGRHDEFQSHLEQVMRDGRKIEKQMKEELSLLEEKLGLELVSGILHDIRDKFECEGLGQYLEDVQEAIVGNLSRFVEGEQEAPQVMIPGFEFKAPKDEFVEFKVNVIVDNSDAKGRPVVFENIPNHRNLFGTIERTQHRSGTWMTDFTKIRAGSILRANGGFLVFNLLDAVTEPGVWKTLKRTLKSRCLEFDSYDPYFFFSATALKPMSVPVDIKIIAIGDDTLYHQLHGWDEDFKKIFKVKADFDSVMKKNEQKILRIASFVKKIVTDEGLKHFDAKGLSALVEEGVRMSGRQKKITTRFSIMADLIREASHWAEEQNARLVSDKHVDQAVQMRTQRHSLWDDRMREVIEDGIIMIDSDGAVEGQVNGLAVYTTADRAFGKPARITAQVSLGRGGVINIEREAKLSGKIHDKGMLILSGFLRSRFAQDKPLSLIVSVCFEQSYGGIDGDSASSTELYAILSRLSEKPIRQDLAVTGSVNQLGQIQPIGGVNEKIEGFFDICNARGLNGKQGVLIPHQNVGDLMLRKDIVAAVKAKKFHVYPVTTIDEGIAILTGVPAGVKDKEGKYPTGTINALVDKRLRKLATDLKDFDKKPAKKKDTEKAKKSPSPKK